MAERVSSVAISRSLNPLREVVASLTAAADGTPPTGNDRRRLVRRVRAAGASAVPALARALASERSEEARWAGYLLSRLGGPRVVERLSQLLEDPRTNEEARARAQELLADLHTSVTEQRHSDEEVDRAGRNPSGDGAPAGRTDEQNRMLADSVAQLLGSLGNEQDVELAAELIGREVPEVEVVSFAAEIARHGGRMAVPLLEAILAARRQSADTLEAIASLRDVLLGRNEPLVSRRGGAGGRRVAARERGLALLERGALHEARASLEQAVAEQPDDEEARSYLGVCLLKLDEPLAAMPQLEHAVRLGPDDPLHRWNLAAAAKAADQMCRAYLALEEYLRLPDETPGARERRREARRFTRSYAKLIRSMHPGVALSEVLRGEQLFLRALADLSAGEYASSVRGFRAVLEALPDHYPSWGNLGAAQLALGDTRGAGRSLRRALELKPDYQIARDNLRQLEMQH